MKKIFFALFLVFFMSAGAAYAQDSAGSNNQGNLKGKAASGHTVKPTQANDKMRTGPAFLYEQNNLGRGGERESSGKNRGGGMG